MVSLKRTLMSDLASSIEVLKLINQGLSTSNLHTPLRYSAVLSSIGKTTHICHQNIPLKKIHCKETITYVSAIPLKLAKIWQQPVGEIASGILAILQNQTTPHPWACIRQNDAGWIEFVLSEYGIEQWRQGLIQQPLSTPEIKPDCALQTITADQLWKLQSGYELCCRWQTLHHQIVIRETLDQIVQTATIPMSSAMFQISSPSLQILIHCLLDICDRWNESTLPQLQQQANQLIVALQKCTAATSLCSPAAKDLIHWLTPTQIVLKQLLKQRLGYHIVEHF